HGSIAEMQTGEGKTLAAVPAVAWLARARKGVHVMTANDYLAGRDARWMEDIYRFLGLSTGYVQQGMTPAERRAPYASDVTYSAAATSSRNATSAYTLPCRTHSKPTRFFAAMWITWSRAAPSRWWMNSRAGLL